ncbi:MULTISPECIES: phosphate acyltransferase PlsX [unclassified Petrotoga]|jgi:glycerol-3-phosphate acyltransferase PlsX|uniref:phosphate acyltransferase PlsX n=1 Tax=unclassified Petrotoga TaxID=2620614 RepID=UPI000CB445A1|nr:MULTISPECIES: phosphate acyltransferase PlsX [unclassified Petrotoga]PNR87866.1 phosphate acyltransferase [Petrotoga sp. 9T1HF07.CasAA.8.2]RLL83158.1 phosphate acyltransferase [Petrotoga sp. Shatin.DS.tank11.9.2.9.3]
MDSVKIGIDLYGGDNAPSSVVEGALFALKNKFLSPDELVIVGNEISKEDLDKISNLKIVPAKNLVSNETKPTEVLKMKESSMYLGCEMLKNNELNAFVSAGNTGALLSSGTFVAGRLPGIKRPALVLALPSKSNKPKILVDAGANAEVKAEHFYDFAREGIAYAKFLNLENPRVGILNIGSEDEKGNSIVREASNLLKEEKKFNYVGYVEARELFDDTCDIIVTDGFTGNNVLKTMEGTAYFILHELKETIKKGGLFTKLGALFLRGSLKSLVNKIDYRSYGGTFFLGVNGVLVKAHGSSDAEAIANALYVAYRAAKFDLIEKIEI